MLATSTVEQKRLFISKNTEAKKKSALGQFFTPARTATFMANLFPAAAGDCRLLDAGAGIGSLTAAFLDKWHNQQDFEFEHVTVDAFEIDHTLHTHIVHTLETYHQRGNFAANIRGGDFVHTAVESLAGSLFAPALPTYTHIILNPPYKKIPSHSAHRLALRRVKIETVNLYSAFVALAIALAAPGGQIVAIIPRSFCNGPYYRPFREFMLERAAIRHIHLFDSRTQTFKDDEVLQENIILHLERSGTQGTVTVSTSADATFSNLSQHEHPFERIVSPADPEHFIHIPTSVAQNTLELLSAVRYSLNALGINISTGPIVDFRLKEHLRDMPEAGSVPLLYPAHFNGNSAIWPIAGMKKPNAIMRNTATEKGLYPNGFYCVVKRFSSKEEKRRIMASVVEPNLFGETTLLGFENHLNLFHENKQGLPKALAYGLATFLNSSAVDESFRCFNGHTQVNATDLRLMKYPSRATLIRLGEWTIEQHELTQAMIDAKLETLSA